jgi:hypothetical protein
MTWTSSTPSAQQLQQQTVQCQVVLLTVRCTQAAALLQQQPLLVMQLACRPQEVSWSVAAAAAEAGRRLPPCQQADSSQVLLLLLPLAWICTSRTQQQQLLQVQSKVPLLAVHLHLH